MVEAKASLTETITFLLNMAETFRNAQRVAFNLDRSVVFSEFEVDGMVDGFLEKAETLRLIKRGM